MGTEILKTEEAISFVKETFSKEFAKQLELTKISSPILVLDGTGINDDLNGTERSVKFPVKAMQDQQAVVVNSLAKWKRIRLMELGIKKGKGILTDMRAIRPDEDFTPIHSIYVDQWDWEKCIDSKERTLHVLKSTVNQIYKALKLTEKKVEERYSEISSVLPEMIHFIHTEELLQMYPTLSAKERETAITKVYGAVFIIGIGGKLSNGEIHDGRAPDYDDWSSLNKDGYTGLNGDILVWNPVLEMAFELSSMGIRVDKTALVKQLEEKRQLYRKELLFHQLLLSNQLPQSIGGGIGQSRVCMFMLRKKHIGEVQVGLWPDTCKAQSKKEGIFLM
ncbi:MAG TPA: aspartate--ammonia ligase [Bacteroidales bacterium]|nr:aspartate--ammonia ligase [Bacteroidales bacterium]